MKPCAFFQRGYCNKGNACGFSHAQVPTKSNLENDIARQVDYWFSDVNFENDKFLLGQATKEGRILIVSLHHSLSFTIIIYSTECHS